MLSKSHHAASEAGTIWPGGLLTSPLGSSGMLVIFDLNAMPFLELLAEDRVGEANGHANAV